MLRFAFQIALLASVCLWAWRSGGKAERIGSAILLAMWCLQMIAVFTFPARHFDRVDVVTLVVDLLGLIAMIWLALTANRFWPLCFAALQLLSTSTHFLRLAEVPMEPLVYAIMVRGPSYGLILVLAFGTWNVVRRRRMNEAASSAVSSS